MAKLIYNTDTRGLQRSLTDKTSTSFQELLQSERGASVAVELYEVDNSGGYSAPGTSAYEIRIGRGQDAILTTGKITLSWTGTTASIDLAAPKLASRIEAALNAVAEIDTAGGVDVVELTPATFSIAFRTAGTRAAITVSYTGAQPDGATVFDQVDDGSIQTLALDEGSLASLPTTGWSAITAPAATVTTIEAGTATVRKVIEVSVSAEPGPGSYLVLLDDGTESAPIPTDSTGKQFEALFPVADCSAEKTGYHKWQVTFPLADTSTITEGTHSLIDRAGISGTLSLDTAELKAYREDELYITLLKSGEVHTREKFTLPEPSAETTAGYTPAIFPRLVNGDALAVPAAPDADNDSTEGYGVGSVWVYNGEVYGCTDNTATAAVWAGLTSTAELSAYLPLAGGTMTGALTLGGTLDVNGQEITGVIDLHSTGDLTMELGDAAGANRVEILDSAASTVAFIDSLGNADFIAALTALTVNGRDVAADGVTADAALPKAGGAMTGAITTTSTFDGRDVAIDGSKLDGHVEGADEFGTEPTDFQISYAGDEFTTDLTRENIRANLDACGRHGRFVDMNTGNDSNGGNDWANAKKTIDGALAVAQTIYLAEGVHWPWDWNGANTTGQDFAIIGASEKTWVGYLNDAYGPPGYEVTWAANGTYAWVRDRSSTGVGNVSGVFRSDELDDYGLPLALTRVATEAACAALAESYYPSGVNDVSVNSSAPDDELVISANSTGNPAMGSDASNFDRYYESVTFVGQHCSHTGNGGATSKVCYNNCRHTHGSPTTTTQDLIDINGIAFTLSYKCRAGYGRKDLWNYHEASSIDCIAYEVDCVGAHAGLQGAGAHQITTMHDGGTIWRINGRYSDANQVIADTNTGTTSWNLGCVATNGADSNVLSLDSAVMNWINCKSGGWPTDANLHADGGTINHRGSNTGTTLAENGGTIGDYTP